MIKKSRVVLNLTLDEAGELNGFLDAANRDNISSTALLISKICKRINKTILKQQFFDKCKAEGFTPTKEQTKEFLKTIK